MYSDNKQIRDVADVAARIMAGLPPLEEKLHPNQQKIDVVDDEKIDGKDFAKLRKMKKEEIEIEEESHQSKTTMKHIPNPTPAQKQAAKDIKPGVGGYRDRIDMLKSAGVKEEVEELDELSKSTLGSYANKATKDATTSSSASANWAHASDKAKNPRVKAAAAKYSDEEEVRKQKRLTGVGKAVSRLSKEEVEELDEVKMADLPSTKVQGRAYGASKPEASAFDVLKGPKDKELKSIESEKKKKKMSEMVATYKESGMKAFFESIEKEEMISEEPDSAQFAKELEDQKKRAAGTKPQADVAKPSVQAVKQEEVELNLEDYSLEEIAEFILSEDFEQLDELTKKTLASYVNKATKDAATSSSASSNWAHTSSNAKNPRVKAAAAKYSDEEESRKQKRLSGVGNAVNRLAKEQTEIQVINADVANGVDQVNIEERTLTAGETDKKEEIVKSMKKGLAGFKERYGKDAKSVMYATATKQAKGD